MMDYSHRQKALAYVLAGIAGYVDAMGFRHLGGVFVSFMSGNTTRLGVDIAMGDWDKAGQVASIIVLFVAAPGLVRTLVPFLRERRAVVAGGQA